MVTAEQPDAQQVKLMAKGRQNAACMVQNLMGLQGWKLPNGYMHLIS